MLPIYSVGEFWDGLKIIQAIHTQFYFTHLNQRRQYKMGVSGVTWTYKDSRKIKVHRLFFLVKLGNQGLEPSYNLSGPFENF